MSNSSGYKTRQRALIEKILKENSGEHITVDEILNKLSAMGTPVGRTTVYRCLDRLMEYGVVKKYCGESGESACYQYMGNGECTEHFHLKCTECGKLLHIECDHITKLAEHIAQEHGFSVNKLKTTIYGICEDCAKK